MADLRQTRFLAAGSAALASTSASAAGLPQIDPTWFTNQLLWLAICFLVMYLAVSRFITPTIQSILAMREEAIDEAIREAEKAKNAAESTRGSSESASQTARIQAAEIIAKTQAQSSSEATEQLQKIDRDIARRVDHAAAVLDDAVAKAASGIEAAAQDLASAMVARLMGDASATAEPKLKLAVKR